MKNILEKLKKAREIIQKNNLKKEGKNTFSKYDYFTPEQIYKLTSEAENECGLLSKFDLIKNDLGVYGKLTIYDIDSSENVEFIMASAIPEIKATNLTQQLGGAVTYTHRYLLTTAYKIAENQLDFDSNEQTQKKADPNQPEKWLNAFENAQKTIYTTEFKNCWDAVNNKNYTIEQIRKKYKVSKETELLLLNKTLIFN